LAHLTRTAKVHLNSLTRGFRGLIGNLNLTGNSYGALTGCITEQYKWASIVGQLQQFESQTSKKNFRRGERHG